MKKSTQIKSWLGIKYAEANRFQSPKILPFDDTKSYDHKGPSPMQAGDPKKLGSASFSEDCLTLNIWAPENKENKSLPVIVYIFGGGWNFGSNNQDVSDASGLAKTGRAIGVSINYRVGAFGWLSLAQYGGKLKNATNLGLQDIVTALEWIKENIKQFGGDPENITLAGHSAGAFNCLSLMGVPAAKGLFQHIAAFSGMPSRLVPAWISEKRTLEVLKKLGIENEPEKILTVDAQKIISAMNSTLSTDPGTQHGVDNDTIAIADDRYLPNGIIEQHPMEALKFGKNKNVDILFSSTSHETYWWVLHNTEAFNPGSIEKLTESFAYANRIPLSKARKIISYYDKSERKPIEVRGLLLTDFSFTLPQTRGAMAHAENGGKAYLLATGPVKGAEVAVHGTEMYGIVGQHAPNSSDEQIKRDNFVRDCVLSLAENKDLSWPNVIPGRLIVKENGNLPYDATEHALEVLKIFRGVARP